MSTTELSELQLSWLRIRAVARRHRYVLQRSPHRLFDITIWPLVDVLLFGSIGAFVAKQPEEARRRSPICSQGSFCGT